ncbi:MAG: DNA recombination protein RmuC [Oleiphilaceae bacterium]|nr:DNA recombination protein RmuC [Oleiphilaceae bacterium]
MDIHLLLGAASSVAVMAVAILLFAVRRLRNERLKAGQLQHELEQGEREQLGLREDCQRYEEQAQQLAEQVRELTEENKRLQAVLNEQQVRAGEGVVRIEHLQARLEERQAEMVSLEERYRQLDTEHRRQTESFAALHSSIEEKERQHRQQLAQFEEQKALLTKEFENLAHRIFEEKGKSFTSQSQQHLEQMLTPFREQIREFRQRVDGIQKENHEAAGSLRKELEQLRRLNQEMTEDARNLTRALKGDKKKVGVWGEVQLEKTLQLAGLVKGAHYDSQAHFKDEEGRNNYPDFVIKLPDDKHMVIDSKVSLVDYDAAISATDEAALHSALTAHAQAVKNHIDGLSGKDYSNLIGMRSPSFVLMFMPIEPAYIEALKINPELFNYGYQRNVVLVSHTTLMPILRTVANLWMVEQSNREAKAISDRAGDVYNQVCLLAERLAKLGGTLQTANRQYNQTVVALAGQQGLHGKVERFNQLSSKVTKTMPELEPIHSDLELERLEVVRVEQSDHADAPEPTE